MVKKLLAALTVFICISSCGFFGDTAFSTAFSEQYDFLSYSEIDDFYILDNGSLDLLIFVINDTGTTTVAIFDTSLNLRGYMKDGVSGVLTDGVGFVDHDGNFVIGATKITLTGTTDLISPVGLLNVSNNTAVIPFSTASDYIEVMKDGNVNYYNDSWIQQGSLQQINNYTDTKIINQNNRYFSDIVFAKMSGEVFVYTKSDLYIHAQAAFIDLITPTFSIPNSNLSGFATRCSRGYFVSTYDGDYILYGNTGNEIDRIENDDYYGQAVTIDYDCEYYYYINRDKGLIIKERLSF